jgi:hypothetical protein
MHTLFGDQNAYYRHPSSYSPALQPMPGGMGAAYPYEQYSAMSRYSPYAAAHYPSAQSQATKDMVKPVSILQSCFKTENLAILICIL